MRVVVFFIYLCSFLLSGQNAVAANTRHSHNPHAHKLNLEKKHHGKYTNNDQGYVIIDDTDVDIAEENHIGDNFKNANTNKLTTGKYLFSESWHDINVCLFVSNYLDKAQHFFLPCCNQSPIYITQRVLRI